MVGWSVRRGRLPEGTLHKWTWCSQGRAASWARTWPYGWVVADSDRGPKAFLWLVAVGVAVIFVAGGISLIARALTKGDSAARPPGTSSPASTAGDSTGIDGTHPFPVTTLPENPTGFDDLPLSSAEMIQFFPGGRDGGGVFDGENPLHPSEKSCVSPSQDKVVDFRQAWVLASPSDGGGGSEAAVAASAEDASKFLSSVGSAVQSCGFRVLTPPAGLTDAIRYQYPAPGSGGDEQRVIWRRGRCLLQVSRYAGLVTPAETSLADFALALDQKASTAAPDC